MGQRISRVKMRLEIGKQKAFSLIELLVVLLIISIVTAIAVIAFRDFGRGRRDKLALKQFYNVMSLAQQRAILQPAVLGLVLTKNGYVFYRYWQDDHAKTAGWKRLSEDHLSKLSGFLSDITIKLDTKYVAFSPKTASSVSPKIIFLPSGDVTPFTVTVQSKPVFRVSRVGQTQWVDHD